MGSLVPLKPSRDGRTDHTKEFLDHSVHVDGQRYPAVQNNSETDLPDVADHRAYGGCPSRGCHSYLAVAGNDVRGILRLGGKRGQGGRYSLEECVSLLAFGTLRLQMIDSQGTVLILASTKAPPPDRVHLRVHRRSRLFRP